MNTLLFFRIDAWGPSWIHGKLFPGVTPLTLAGACCSSRCQAQNLQHMNQVLWEVWWCCCPARPRNSSIPLQGWSELTLLWLPEEGSAAGHAPVAASELCKVLCKVKGTAASCTHLHSGFEWCWTGTCCLRFSQLLPGFKENVLLPFFCVGNAQQFLGRPTEVLNRIVNLLSHWGVVIYTWSNFTKIKVEFF